MTQEQLQAHTRKQLADMARQRGVAGWHSMRKDELIRALGEAPRPAATTSTATATARKPASPAREPESARPRPLRSAARDTSSDDPELAEERIERSKYDIAAGIPTKDLSARLPKNLPAGYGKDRIVVMVRDPFWLHAYWEVSHNAIQRAEAALGQDWHGAKPILRVFDVSSLDTTATSESVVRDIEIHGGCNNWYIEVNSPPRTYRIDIGYLSKRGQFFVLARSNVVSTPRAGVSDVIDENWADVDSRKADRIYAMSSGYEPGASSLEVKRFLEERLRRPIGSGAVSSFGFGSGSMFGVGMAGAAKQRKFRFELEAELIVYGSTEPDARVTLQGEPIKLRPDGTFTVRFSLPDSRQIIPAVATSGDGIEERTIVLAVERNTKHLEPLIHDVNGEG
jgi:hypothetical protein